MTRRLVEALEAVASGEADTVEGAADASIVTGEEAAAEVDDLLDDDGDADVDADLPDEE